jgi:outer membrane receptor protein involved in Fe transport
MTIRKILFSVFGIAASILSAGAQNTIKGKVSDNNGAPVSFALLKVTTPDSVHKNIAQKIADTGGNFILLIEKKGTYIIHASCMGFEDASNTITINGSEDNISIVMKKSEKNLSEVTVTSKQQMLTQKIDRMVMNVENNPLTAGKSTMEALQLAPGIVIYNNQITLNGMAISRVMINGKMLQLRGNDLINYLTSLRSDDIKSIELLPHPPAEYDAEGAGGLINIILKKNAQAGLNGSAYANYIQGKYAGTNEGVQLNFKKKKIGLFANYSFNTGKYFQVLDQNRSVGTDGIYTATNDAKKSYQSNNIRTGITYDINDKQYLSLDYTGNFGTNNENFYATSKINYSQNPANNSSSNGFFPNNSNWKYSNVGLNYHLQTDSLGSAFTVLTDYIYNYNFTANDVKSTTVFNGKSTDTAYRNNTPSPSKIFTAEVKYLKKINAKSSIGFGGKISATNIHNQAAFQYQSPFGSNWIDNTVQNYVYDYAENIAAGYVNYQGKILKTDVQFGLRGENTHYTGKLYDTSYVENGRNYFGLFPTIFLRRNLDSAGNHALSFNYSRRLSRPGFGQLSPHIVYVDNYTIGAGNPFLQPEYDNSFKRITQFK